MKYNGYDFLSIRIERINRRNYIYRAGVDSHSRQNGKYGKGLNKRVEFDRIWQQGGNDAAY
jgi:hypothetical protein